MATLCSNGYRQFYNALQSETVSTDDILNIIPDAFTFIADELSMGKFEIKIDIPSSGQEFSEYNDFRVLYEFPEGFEYAPHTRIIKVPGGNGRVSFAAFPRKGCKWDDESEEALDFLIKNLYVVLSKARVTELLNKRQLTDYLTSLPNTAYFTKFGHELGLRGVLEQYTVVFSNLRSFNYINQQMGSHVGDMVLKEYSRKLKDFYRPDELIARFGGDNFVAVLRNENVEKYLNYISLINISVASDNQTRILGVAARSGICPITSSMGNINEALGRANASLTYAKRVLDTDYVYFTEEILERTSREREIISGFRSALSHKEYLVYYQPKVDLMTNRICGCEALVRWLHNGRVVSPAEFVPILENSGLICDLDFYVMERVCEDINGWLEDGIIPPRISVNFSKHHLRNPHLIDDVNDVLSKYTINSDYIEIELTESASSEDYQALEQFVDELVKRGIRISIDDFGTGYSSLSLLKDLHVNMIKIDKSFVDNIAVDESKDRIVLSSILTMINGLGMEVIAEGCETAEQARILKDMNCNLIQGYLFDKPLTHDEYTAKLSKDYIYPVSI